MEGSSTEGKHQKSELLCCNSDCNSKSQNFTIAPKSAARYYQVSNSEKRKQYVCEVCLKEYMLHAEKMVNWALDKKPLFNFKLPEVKETVLITDSDEEQSDDPDEEYPEEMPMEIEDLEEVVKNVIEKIDLKTQYEENVKILIDDMSTLKNTMVTEMDNLNDMQRTIDSLRSSFYATFEPRRREEPPIEIENSYFEDQDVEVPYDDRQGAPRSYFGPGIRSPIKLGSISGVAMKKVTQVHRNTLDALTHSDLGNQSEVVALESVPLVTPSILPPIAPLERPQPKPGDIVHVMKSNYFGVWSKARVLELIDRSNEIYFKIKFESSYRKGLIIKIVDGRHLAYSSPCPTRIPVGTRVIAIFRDDENSATSRGMSSKESYYCGVVAENPKSMNSYRYLIFFDDGYAQYVHHNKILVVVKSSPNVWEDIHHDSKEFVKKYLEAFPERPMVRMNTGQVVKTEWNGKWWVARVLEVDGSLVHLHFDADGRTEWIYRGSTRLGPLYTEIANANARSQNIGNFNRSRGPGTASLKKLNLPYVEYTRGNEVELEQLASIDSRESKSDTNTVYEEDKIKVDGSQSTPSMPIARAVARKSTTNQRKFEERKIEYGLPCTDDKMVKYVKNLNVQLRTYVPHDCSPKCLEDYPYPQECTKGQNPLAKPLLCGWLRHIVRHRGGTKRVVLYVAPCARRIRNLEELHSYLRKTKSTMPIDLFDFDFWVHCLAEYTVLKHFSYIKDVSYGKEKVPIPAVNWVDYSYPEYVEYSTVRLPTAGVHLNLDQDFLVCCDCDDDCQDKEKCACWQLTIQGTTCGPTGQADPAVGYLYKRLPEPLTTGIYECNSRCKCRDTCLNRVAQLPLQQRLQVFHTRNRGWGVQCLNDIPQGAFICIYVGQLLTEQGANEDGKTYGDEYLAELDYIEVVERIKEGYESDVMEDIHSDVIKSVSIANEYKFQPPKMQTVETVKDYKDKDFTELSIPKSDSAANTLYPLHKGDSEEEGDDGSDSSSIKYPKGHRNSYDVDKDFKTSTRLELTPSDLSIRSRLRKRTMKSDEHPALKPDDSTPNTRRKSKREAAKRNSDTQSESSNMSDDEDSEGGKLLASDVGFGSDLMYKVRLSVSAAVSSPFLGDVSIPLLVSSLRLKTSALKIIPAAVSKRYRGTRQPSRFAAAEPRVGPVTISGKSKFRSVREVFGPGEYCYIMDAKSIGNVGRYLNHSCSPNVFVQNVFVDSHDLRFPWVAFFALTYITAGTELTWDYNYDVGSVPGKVMYCYCGSNDCRGRLL